MPNTTICCLVAYCPISTLKLAGATIPGDSPLISLTEKPDTGEIKGQRRFVKKLGNGEYIEAIE